MSASIFDIMIENANDWKWVDRELCELQDAGYITLGDALQYYLDVFNHNKVPVKKFKIFMNNFMKTYKEELL